MSDKYEWLEVLGRGFSGVCRKVRQKETGQIFVIKQIDVSFVTKDEYTTAVQEAELLSSLCHPNVIRLPSLNIFFLTEHHIEKNKDRLLAFKHLISHSASNIEKNQDHLL